MENTNDVKATRLLELIKKERQEINEIERPQWKTDCTFNDPWNTGKSFNLHTLNDVKKIQELLAFLLGQTFRYNESATLLGLEKSDYKWTGFTNEQWLHDFKLRVAKIQIGARKDKLSRMEATLETILSPEMKARLALEEIEKEFS